MTNKEQPDYITDEHLTYLDDLRESGATNMFGASPYLQETFDLTRHDANRVLTYWMETFESRHAGVD
jgi:hypothetical protein